MTVVVAAGWAALVVAVRVRRGPDPARIRALRPPKPVPWRAVVVVATVACAAVVPPLAMGMPLGAWAVPRLRRRRAAARAKAAVEADLPEVVDLLRMCVGAGLTVPLAVEAVARRADGPVARALAATVAEARQRGRLLADALDDLPARVDTPAAPAPPEPPSRSRRARWHMRPPARREPAGRGYDRGEDAVRGLVGVLVGSERYGHAIGPALERLAAECRADERRRAEAAARRVPVLLLFPLVTCILPAFALLTVAPLIAGALQALRLS